MALTDKPSREIDSVAEKEKHDFSSGIAALAQKPDHNVLVAEKDRQTSDFKNLRDDFGKHWFAPAHDLLSHENGPKSVNARDGFDENRVKRIEAIGQGRGNADVSSVAALQAISGAKTLPELMAATDQVNKISAIGENRADRLTYFLGKRSGMTEGESAIKNQIEAIKSDKLSGVAKLQEQETAKKAEKELGKKDGAESSVDKLIKFQLVSDKELRQRADDVTKDFASWASVRETVGLLGNKEKAEPAIKDLVGKAREGNPAARDALAATLVSGSASDSWLIAKRGDFNGVQRPIAIPNLPAELSTQIKLEAAKGLISIGEAKGLTRSEQMALAIAMGEAFSKRLNGDSSRANNDLLNVTVKHFVKSLSGDPASARTEQEKEQTVGRLSRAMGGLVEAVRGNAKGAACLREFVNQIMVGDERTVRISPFVKQLRTFDGMDTTTAPTVSEGGLRAGEMKGRNPHLLGDATDSRVAETALRSLLGMMAGDRSTKKSKRDAGAPTTSAKDARLDVSRSGEAKRMGRATFHIGERKDFVELASGRYYDATLRRFFVREGDTLVEDSMPGTDRERSEIAELAKKRDTVVFVLPPASAQPQSTGAGNADNN